MPVDELAALLRVITLISDLDPANAWELDAQLDGLAKVSAAFAESLDTWGGRLSEIGLHASIASAAATGSDHLSQTATAFAAARRNLRTVYAAQLAAAEAQVSQIERRDFWGETPSGTATQGGAMSPSPESGRGRPPLQANAVAVEWTDPNDGRIVRGKIVKRTKTTAHIDWGNGGRVEPGVKLNDPALRWLTADDLKQDTGNAKPGQPASKPASDGRAGRPQAVAAQLQALTERVRARADHGVTDAEVLALFDGLSVAEIKQVADATGMPATYMQRNRDDLIRYVRLNTVESALTFRSVAGDRVADTAHRDRVREAQGRGE